MAHDLPGGEEHDSERRRAELLAEEDARAARDLEHALAEGAGVPDEEPPFDVSKELGVDWNSSELRGYAGPRGRKPGPTPRRKQRS